MYNGEENGGVGILSVWNKNNFTLLKSKSVKGYIIIEGEWGENKQLVTIVNVYSPCMFSERKVLWEELIKSRGDDDEGLTPTKDEGTCLRRLSMFRKEVH